MKPQKEYLGYHQELVLQTDFKIPCKSIKDFSTLFLERA